MNEINIGLAAGLGNPGEEYKNTRHNAGFLFADALAEKFGAPEFAYDKKLKSEISEFKIKNSKLKILLAKPQTFMNKSGEAVAALAKFYKIKPEKILVIHDDIDIPFGDLKFSFGRSSAGHKGVESIIKSLKTKNFWRLRIGIQPPGGKRTPADKIILKKFSPAEMRILQKVFAAAVSELF